MDQMGSENEKSIVRRRKNSNILLCVPPFSSVLCHFITAISIMRVHLSMNAARAISSNQLNG